MRPTPANNSPVRPLADWVGQRVIWEGYLEYSEVADGYKRFLVKPIWMRNWATDEVRQIDHLWLSAPLDALANCKPVQRLERPCGTGVVTRYYRTNGTWDYGLAWDEGLHLLKALSHLRRLLTQGNKSLPLASRVLAEIEQHWADGRLMVNYHLKREDFARVIAIYRQTLDARVATAAKQRGGGDGWRSYGAPRFEAPKPRVKRSKAVGVKG